MLKRNTLYILNYLLFTPFLIGCTDHRSDGKLTKLLFHDSLWSSNPVLYLLPLLIFVTSFGLSKFCKKYINVSVSLVFFYALTNWTIYVIFHKYTNFDQGGVYLSYCIDVFIILLLALIIRSVSSALRERCRSTKKIVTDLVIVFLMMIFSYWLGLSYRLGAGECSTLGRVLTPYENILAMTNESLKHSPQETRERLEEIASEKIRDIYKEFVSKYQSGLYRDALSELPYFERAPDGNYRKYYDDFMDRVIRGTSYARFEFEVIHQHEDSFQAGNRLAYLVDNCGEALFLEFSKKSSKRKKVIWSR